MTIIDGCIAKFDGDWTKQTCGGCYRFTHIPWRQEHICSCRRVEGAIEADHPACDIYWDRAEQEALEAELKREREADRQLRWAENEYTPSMLPEWRRDWDYMSDRETAPYPICPDCEEPIFSLEEGDRCYWCGRRILVTPELDRYYEPPEVKTMDCFLCGGKGTMEYTESKYNGHKHGYCLKCGMRFME